MKMPPVGSVVVIEFLDHDQSSDEVFSMTVYGRVAAVTKNEVLVDTWHQTEDTDDSRETQKRNNALDSSAIVRRAILDWYPLRRRD
jgi:hypothetical protein